MASGVGSWVHAAWGLPPQSPPLSLPRNPKGTSGGQRGLVIAASTHPHGPTPGPFTPVAYRPQLLPLKFQSPKIRMGVGGGSGRVAGKGLISLFCSGVVWASPALFSSPPSKRSQIWLLSQGGGEMFLLSCP